MDIGSYLSGFADGEGSFCICFSPSQRHAFGWEIRPSFSVSQKRERAEVLQLFRDFLGCGTLRNSQRDGTIKYEVRSISDLVEKVIPHFDRYPLLSGKRQEFEIFSTICKRMSRGEHLTLSSFKELVELAFRMNFTGNRRYTKEEIFNTLRER